MNFNVAYGRPSFGILLSRPWCRQRGAHFGTCIPRVQGSGQVRPNGGGWGTGPPAPPPPHLTPPHPLLSPELAGLQRLGCILWLQRKKAPPPGQKCSVADRKGPFTWGQSVWENSRKKEERCGCVRERDREKRREEGGMEELRKRT